MIGVRKPGENPSIRTVLFDLDGTLIDTEPTSAEVIQQVSDEWKIGISHEDSRYLVGQSWLAGIEYLFGKYHFPFSRERALEIFLERYRSVLENELRSVPGGVEAVRLLRERYRLGVVSGSGRHDVFWALEKLGIRECFEVILGCEDYPRSKPEPDGYLRALQILGENPQYSLVFEDSPAGIAAAKAAGFWVVAITATNHFGHDLSRADGQIDDLTLVDDEWIENFSSYSCGRRISLNATIISS